MVTVNGQNAGTWLAFLFKCTQRTNDPIRICDSWCSCQTSFNENVEERTVQYRQKHGNLRKYSENAMYETCVHLHNIMLSQVLRPTVPLTSFS